MRQYMIDKHARKMRDREINRERHANSDRHEFMPVSLAVLIEARQEATDKVCHSFKYDECIRILKQYKVYGKWDNYMLDDLEKAICLIVANTRKDTPKIRRAISIARDKTSNRFTPNKLRRHYHRLHCNEPLYTPGNHEHDEYEHILSTWQAIYGMRWDGEPFHIDHLKPLYTATSVRDVHMLNRLDNLCMMSQHDNQSKRHSFPHPIYYTVMEKL